MSRLAVSLAVAFTAAYVSIVAYGVQDKPPAPGATTPPVATPSKTPEPTPNLEKLSREPAPIPPKIETWFQVAQDGETVGFAHEVISRAGPNRFGYFYECDFDYSPKEANFTDSSHVGMQVTGTLDDSFNPVQLKLTRAIGNDSFEVSVHTSENRRLIEFRIGDKPAAQTEYDANDSHLYFQPISLYRMRQRGEMAKEGDRKLSAPTGSGAQIDSVKATVFKAEFKDYLGRKNTMVNLVRFIERGGLSTEFVVDRYGRVLERRGFHNLPGIKMVAVSDPKDARGAGNIVIGKGRRDPFRKALTPIDKVAPEGSEGTRVPGETGETAEVPPGPIDPTGVPAKLEETGRLIDDLRSAVARGDDKEAGEAYQKFLVNYHQLRPMVINNPNQLGPLDKLKFDAEEVHGGADKLLERAKGLLASVDDFLSALDVPGITKRIGEMKGLKGKREFINEDVRLGKLIEMIRAAEKKQDQATARLELSKKRIDLTGVVVSSEIVRDVMKLDFKIAGARLTLDEPMQLRHTTAYAVINDDYYREGDIVKGEEVRVDKILRQAVTISYKEEVREVPLKKESSRKP